MGQSYGAILKDNYLVDTPHLNPWSGSQIGMPGIRLLWEKFFPFERPTPTFALKRKWLGGHMFELEIMHLLERMNIEYVWQPEIEVFGIISGHPDFIMMDDDKPFLLECKNVGPNKYKEYARGMNNQQYITQFALYCSHFSCGGAWIIGNNDTGEITVLVVENYDKVLRLYQKQITDAVNLHTVLKTAESFEAALEYIQVPAPTNRTDGSYGIAPTLYAGAGVLHPCCALYEHHVDEKGRYTVTGYNYPEGAKQYEPAF